MIAFIKFICFILAIFILGSMIMMTPSCQQVLYSDGILGVSSKILCGKVNCFESKLSETQKE